uniref:VP3 n=1 Tax=Ninarumi virus TaxID=2108521 RepID=A0A2P1K546_9REOV|nr:VP3 [Ninarumi virus]
MEGKTNKKRTNREEGEEVAAGEERQQDDRSGGGQPEGVKPGAGLLVGQRDLNDVVDESKQRTAKRDGKQKPAEYFDGDAIREDSGQLLSVFALTEILEKVRSAQAAIAAASQEIEVAPPNVQNLLVRLNELADIRHYRVENTLPSYYRHIVTDSRERFFQVNTHYEKMSQVSPNIGEAEPAKFFATVLAKVNHLREEGSFILYNVATRDYQGAEIVSEDALGVDLGAVPKMLSAADRGILRDLLNACIVENEMLENRRVDAYRAAMPDPVYQIHHLLMSYITGGQNAEFRASMAWLEYFSERKEVDFSRSHLTDMRRQDTFYILSYLLPINPNIVWTMPRCGVVNLVLNIAMCMPVGDYIAPNPRTASITLTQRITQTSPFSIIVNSTPTTAQMDDVRKITLALLFPNQVILDLKEDQKHSIDASVRMVAGVVGHLMFTYGPNFTNITPLMARKLDAAFADFLRYMTNERVPVVEGPTGAPLDFRIGRDQVDVNGFACDYRTGAGYNGAGLVDCDAQPGPYAHVQRIIRYCGLNYRDVIEERVYGNNVTYPNYQRMMALLIAAGKTQEASFLRLMQPHQIVRFAYLNQIINRDLLSAFSLPDDRFRAMLGEIADGVDFPRETVVLEVSWISLWHAFHLRFMPTSRSENLVMQPLIESVYASELSILKENMQRMSVVRAAYPDNVETSAPSDVWKAALSVVPEALREVMNMTHSLEYITVYDIMVWARNHEQQDSLGLRLQREAWRIAADFEELMLTDQVFLHRDELPEPRLDDVDEFRRQGFYYTNVLEARPPLNRVLVYTREIAMREANQCSFISSLRPALDQGLYIQFSRMLRPFELRVYNTRPPEDVLQQLPYRYDQSEGQPLMFARLEYGERVIAYYLIYHADYADAPDKLVGLNPTYSMVNVFLRKRVIYQIEPGAIFAVINKQVRAFKRKMRVMDMTTVLRAGVKLAVAQAV